MTPDAATILHHMTATWPPAARHRVGPWTLREGPGGGSRVTCAVADGPVGKADLAPLVQAAARLGQPGLVMVRQGEAALDQTLQDAGWRMGDEVVLYLAPAAAFAAPPPMAAFALWPPLAVQRLIWDEGGIGADRLAIMDRAEGPKTTLLGRNGDRPAGTAYVATAGGIAFLHALTVVPALLRRGTARHIVAAAGGWAQGAGADWLALAVTRGNAPARALYASLGMDVVGHYHYRLA
ncbi:MAG: GNAT family N-acetyltransferase [Gemmobacter sp.]